MLKLYSETNAVNSQLFMIENMHDCDIVQESDIKIV